MKGMKLIVLGMGAIIILIAAAGAQDSLNVTRLSSIYTQVDDGQDVVISGDYAYVACDGLAAMDISNPAAPTLAGFCGCTGWGESVAIQDNFAYLVANFSGLHIIDISNPHVPVEVGYHTISGYNYGVAVSGRYAFVTNFSEGLRIIDVSNPANPWEVSSLNLPGWMDGVTASGHYVYLAGYTAGVWVVDVSNPAIPAVVCVVDIPDSAQNVTVSGNHLYVATHNQGLQIVDITNPLNPVLMGGCPFGSGVFFSESYDVAVSGQFAYVGVGGSSYTWQNGIRVVDISNPRAPVLVGQCNQPGYAYGVAVSGSYVYACGPWVVVQVIDVSSPSNPTPLVYYTIPGQVRNVACQGNYAFVADGDHGFRVVDVTNPATPQEVGINFQASWYVDLAVNGDYAYILGEEPEESNLYVMNISVPSNPWVEGMLGDVGWENLRDVAAAGNYAYVAEGILRVVDVSNPAAPVTAGTCSFDAVANGVAVSGSYAYVTAQTSLRVVSVADPTNPTQVGLCAGLDSAKGVAFSGNYAYVACGINGLHVVNVANPSSPVEVGWCDTPGDARRVAISGNYAYVADANQGLRVVSISNPSLPTVVGYYDTPGLAEGLSVSGNTAFVAEGYSMGIYQFSAPSVTVELMPVNPPIQIPASGGNFQYVITLTNGGAMPQSFDAWIMLRFPNGIWHGPPLGPIALTLNASASITRQRTQNVPGIAPAGEYWYEGRVGDYPSAIWDTSGFAFTKAGSGTQDSGFGDWSNTGNFFEIANDEFIIHHSSFIITTRPNPFNATTILSFEMRDASFVKLAIYDISGCLVTTLVTGWREAGVHEVTFDGSNLPSGIYVYRLQSGEFTASGKMVLLK